jgi:hypothetical protein
MRSGHLAFCDAGPVLGEDGAQGAARAGVAAVTADARLRAHVYALAAQLGCLVAERPGLVFWDARIEEGRVTCAPITGRLTYYCALHELGHAAMWSLAWFAGCGELEREWHAWAWARCVALVEPDRGTEGVIGVLLSTYEGGR